MPAVVMHGLPALDRKLRGLGEKLGKRVMRKALAAGGQLVVREMKKRVAKKTGGLKKSIGKRALRRRGGSFAMIVGPRWPEGAHGHLVELGTVKMAAKPFMRPAFAATHKQVTGVFVKKLAEGIRKVA